jgi:hypothetical protein
MDIHYLSARSDALLFVQAGCRGVRPQAEHVAGSARIACRVTGKVSTEQACFYFQLLITVLRQ